MNNFSINDHNHNLKYNLLHELFWGFGVAFHTIYAVIPLFLKELSAPDYIIVSSAGIFSFVVAFPTLFSAGIGRNIKDIKRAVILVHCIILSVTFLMGFTFTFFDYELVGMAWEVYLTYLIKYKIDDSRYPLNSEINKFIPLLKKQIEIIEPKIIVGLGKVVGKALLNENLSMDQMRGQVHRFSSYPLKITYSLNTLLREQELKKLAWEDFQFIRDFIK